MRTLAVAILMAAAFVGGYQASRMPGAPDMAPTLKQAYDQTLSAAKVVSEAVGVILDSQGQNKSQPASEQHAEPHAPTCRHEPPQQPSQAASPDRPRGSQGTYVALNGRTYLIGAPAD